MSAEIIEEVDEWPWPELPLPPPTTSIATEPVTWTTEEAPATVEAPPVDAPPPSPPPATDPTAALAPAAPTGDRAPVGPYEAFTRTPAPPPARGDSGRWLEGHLLTILALAASAPAVQAPALWVAVCAIAALVMLGIGSVRGQVRTTGSADVVVVPGRVAGRLVLGVVNPVNWLKVILGALAALAFGVVGSAAVAAVRWLLQHGTEGILAAARTGAWAHALTWAAVFACVVLVRGVGQTFQRRAAALRRVTRRLPEFAVAGFAVGALVLCAIVTVAGPGSDLAFLHASDGLGWVPSGLRGDVDALRDDAVHEEIDGVASCVTDAHRGAWTATYTDANPLAAPDVARFTADPSTAPDQATIAAVALAAHNHLAPWVETIEIAVGSDVVLSVDRSGLPRGVPLTDAAALRVHAVGAPAWLTTVAPTVDRGLVLTCSARTPF
jgi:hypothetical protein